MGVGGVYAPAVSAFATDRRPDWLFLGVPFHAGMGLDHVLLRIEAILTV